MKKLDYLIKTLNSEIEIPETEQEKKDLFRSLMNTWKVSELPSEFYEVQDEYLQGVLKVKGITKLEELTEIEDQAITKLVQAQLDVGIQIIYLLSILRN